MWSIIIALLSLGCEDRKHAHIPGDDILARVGDRVITTQDFIRRAEYSPRPSYCKLDNYIHKKIILNSLIAEKLFALEAETRGGLAENGNLNAFLKGRKEQAMRQWHFHEIAYRNAQVDSQEVLPYYRNAGRRYQMAFVVLSDSLSSHRVAEILSGKEGDWETALKTQTGMDTIMVQDVTWSRYNDPKLQLNLYSRPLEKGEVVGPLELSEGTYLTAKVLGWRNSMAITERGMSDRFRSVRQFLKQVRATSQYEDYVGSLMAGKEMQFFPGPFREITRRVRKVYMKIHKNKTPSLNRFIWEEETEFDPGEFPSVFRDLPEEPLFRLDGKIWSIGDFRDLVRSHPLVFRKKRFPPSEFPEHFRNAIADLMRDYYITLDAYERGYDRVAPVALNVQMWHDHILALDERTQILEKAGVSSEFHEQYLHVIETCLNPVVDSLQNKYSAVIGIDMEKFVEMHVTRIDMAVIQKNLPYPVPTPSFPVLTTDNRLDYGVQME